MPVSALNIKIEDGRNYNIPAVKLPLIPAQIRGKGKDDRVPLRTQVDNFDDVYAGVYTNTVTYTLFVP